VTKAVNWANEKDAPEMLTVDDPVLTKLLLAMLLTVRAPKENASDKLPTKTPAVATAIVDCRTPLLCIHIMAESADQEVNSLAEWPSDREGE